MGIQTDKLTWCSCDFDPFVVARADNGPPEEVIRKRND